MFVSHLEEQQERDLFGIGHVREAIVTQNVSEVPSLVDDLLGVVVAHELPKTSDPVGVELYICADDGNVFCQSLSDQKAVERVFVMKLHRREQRCMSRFDGEYLAVIGHKLSFDELLIGLLQSILAEFDLDGDLPIARWADFDFIRWIFDETLGRRTQLGIVEDEP